MIIDVVSDLHGFFPKLEGGDLLIIAGDLTERDTEYQHDDFFLWLNNQAYTKKIFISGNHDNYLEKNNEKFIKTLEKSDLEYLSDSGTELEGFKIWGSPWTKTFRGMNPKCKAFTCDTEEELAIKFSLIPEDVDILITHSPPYGILDSINLYGSRSLRKIIEKITPKLWICGHIHEGYGEFKDHTLDGRYFHVVNASHVNEYYQPVNKPIRVIL